LVKIAKDLLANDDMSTVYKMFPTNSYLYKFFEEKEIPDKMFEVTDKNGVTHYIPNTVVIEFIAKTQGSERKQIEDTLRKIDFKNGDVNHFLKHLATAIADLYGNTF
jgi:hypothetical protein